MNANDIINTVKDSRPGTDNETILKYIREQEKKISRFISRFEGYNDDLMLPNAVNDELYLPEEYSDIYVLYCLTKIDFSYGESTDYRNNMIMHDYEWKKWSSAFTADNMPKSVYIGGI